VIRAARKAVWFAVGVAVLVFSTVFGLAAAERFMRPDRLEGCNEPDGMARGPEGDQYLVVGCPDGLKIMVPLVGATKGTPL